MSERGDRPEHQPRHMRTEHEPQHMRESPARPPGRHDDKLLPSARGDRPEHQPMHMRPERGPQHMREPAARPPGRPELPPPSVSDDSSAPPHAGTERRASMQPTAEDTHARPHDDALDTAKATSSGTGEQCSSRPPGRRGEQPPSSAQVDPPAQPHSDTGRRASMTPAVEDARVRRRDAALDSAKPGSSGTGENGVARPPGRDRQPAASGSERSVPHTDQLKQSPVNDEHGQTPLIKVESPGIDEAKTAGEKAKAAGKFIDKLADGNEGNIISSIPDLDWVHADTVNDGFRYLRAWRDVHRASKRPNPPIS